jgi:hypothetical protein
MDEDNGSPGDGREGLAAVRAGWSFEPVVQLAGHSNQSQWVMNPSSRHKAFRARAVCADANLAQANRLDAALYQHFPPVLPSRRSLRRPMLTTANWAACWWSRWSRAGLALRSSM